MPFFSSRPTSPTGSASTSADRPNGGVTRADILASLAAFDALLDTSKAYRNALLALSSSGDAFGSALGACAKVRGAENAAAGFGSAAAFAHLASNLYGVLADTMYRAVEIPLMDEFDVYKRAVAERQAVYHTALAAKTKALRATEAANNNHAKKRTRDLSSFRLALATLQAQVNDLDTLKSEHYTELFQAEAHNWAFILSKITLLLRCELDIHDRLFSKPSADAGLDALLGNDPPGEDPWGSSALEQQDAPAIYSILPPLGVGVGLSRRTNTSSYPVSSLSSIPTSPSSDRTTGAQAQEDDISVMEITQEFKTQKDTDVKSQKDPNFHSPLASPISLRKALTDISDTAPNSLNNYPQQSAITPHRSDSESFRSEHKSNITPTKISSPRIQNSSESSTSRLNAKDTDKVLADSSYERIDIAEKDVDIAEAAVKHDSESTFQSAEPSELRQGEPLETFERSEWAEDSDYIQSPQLLLTETDSQNLGGTEAEAIWTEK